MRLSNPSSAPVRVVIIGYGLAGAVFHAPLVAATPRMRVAGIVTANAARRAQAARDFPGATLHQRVEEIWLAPDQYDLVVVATPNREHLTQGIASLQAGLPVVIDKPLAASSDEAAVLLQASAVTGVPCTCFQNRRLDGDFLTIRHLLAGDMLGTVTRFASHFDRWRPEPKAAAWRESADAADAGGLLFDLGSHLIDQALQLFGEPCQVYAELPVRRSGAHVDDDSFVALTFASGVIAHLSMSALARIETPRFALRGLKGSYIKYGLDPQEGDLRAGKRPGDVGWGQDPPERWGTIRTDLQGAEFNGSIETLPGAYEHFYDAVCDAVMDGTPMPVDPQSSLRVIEVIEAARQSADLHTVVLL